MNADKPTIAEIVASTANQGRKLLLILHLGELNLQNLTQDEIRDRLAAYADKLARNGTAEPEEASDTDRVQLTDKGKAMAEALDQADQEDEDRPDPAFVDIPDIYDPDPRMSRHVLFGSAIIGAAMYVRHEWLNPEFMDGGGVSEGNFFWDNFDTLVHCIMCAEANLINRIIENGGHDDLLTGLLARDFDDHYKATDD